MPGDIRASCGTYYAHEYGHIRARAPAPTHCRHTTGRAGVPPVHVATVSQELARLTQDAAVHRPIDLLNRAPQASHPRPAQGLRDHVMAGELASGAKALPQRLYLQA